MRDSLVFEETWNYECLGCLHEWQEKYEVRHLVDGHGGDCVVYRRDGYRCVSPWSEKVCPGCGGYDVKILPSGRTAPRPLSGVTPRL